MSNPNENESGKVIIPLLVGAAAGALAYLFVSNTTSESGEKLTETLSKGWASLKEKVPAIEDEFNSLKGKIMDTVKATLAEAEQGAGKVEEL